MPKDKLLYTGVGKNTVYAMLLESVNALKDTTADLMSAKNGMTAEEMRVAIDDIYLAADVNYAPTTEDDFKNLYQTNDGVAQIPVMGVLTPKANPCAAFMESAETEYGYITTAIEKAENDPSVASVDFLFDTPGGYIDGVDNAAMAIATMTKPNRGLVLNKAASAGYWLLSQTDEIVAMSKTAQVGSIGVVVDLIDTSARDEKDGVKRYSLTSSNAPNKRPDMETEDGKRVVIDRLNDIHDVFVSRVADGRGVSTDTVNSDFGRGDMLIAEKALEAGMIDNIIDYSTGHNTVNNSVVDGKNKIEEGNMDKIMSFEDFMKSNPEAEARHKSLVDEAVANAQSEEGKRVNRILALAHVNLTEEAKAAIENGQTPGEYAEAVLENNAEKVIVDNSKKINIPKAPNASDEAETAYSSEQKKALDFWDNQYKKEAK